jgi:hypothetical protein
MGAFLSSLFSEFAARRARLHAAFGDRTASLVEFLLFGGVIMGCLAAVLGEMRGLGPLVALILGYVLLDASRQRALRAGADEAATRRRQDRLAFVLFAALSAMGAAFCAYTVMKQDNSALPPQPGQKFDVDIAPPS